MLKSDGRTVYLSPYTVPLAGKCFFVAMKVLITGASGLLGRATMKVFVERGYDVYGTAHSRAGHDARVSKLDLTDSEAVQAFLSDHPPDVIVHTAAERRPDVVEKLPEASYKLNVVAPGQLAQWCKARTENKERPLLINISTDYVFDGRKPPYKVDDEPNPLNAYGKSKLDGERRALSEGQRGRTCNVRVPVLYGVTESNDESAVNILLDAVNGASNVDKPKKMDANATRYPTNVEDVAKRLARLVEMFGERGSIPSTLHFSATEALTKYDMSLIMAKCLQKAGKQAHTEHLVAETEVDPSAATSRPQNCQLDISAIQSLGVDTSCVSFEKVSVQRPLRCDWGG